VNKTVSILTASALSLAIFAGCALEPVSAMPTTNSTDPVAAAALDSAVAEDVASESAAVGDVAADDTAAVETVETAVPAYTADSAASDSLLDEEIHGIVYMREEEKLARDVYLSLYDMWGVPVFQNIANSESTHMAAVGTLIERYGLDDPTVGKAQGEFADATLQQLYDELTTQGATSLEAALRVGAAIEEIDILDLEEHIAGTDRADISTVYESLVRGSRNHLRSFVSTLERQTGVTYSPEYMDQAAYDAIVGGETERGGPGGQGQGQARGRNR